MNEEHRIGKVSRAAMDHEAFARLNRPSNWIGYARAMHRAATLLQANMDSEMRRFRDAFHADLAKDGSGAFVATGESITEPWLVRHGRDYGPLLLTCGFAIEAALKAIRIQRDAACVANGKSKLGHDQAQLANDAEILLLPAEMVLCLLLTDFVEFAGRYPSAVNERKSHNSISIGDDFFLEFRKFFARLEQIYQGGVRQDL